MTNWIRIRSNPAGGTATKEIWADGGAHYVENDRGYGSSYSMQVYAPGSTLKGATSGFGTKCLDAAAGATVDGTAVQIYDCNNTAAQKWTLNSNGTIVGVGSGTCLDATAHSTPIELWSCSRGPNQLWSRS